MTTTAGLAPASLLEGRLHRLAIDLDSRKRLANALLRGARQAIRHHCGPHESARFRVLGGGRVQGGPRTTYVIAHHGLVDFLSRADDTTETLAMLVNRDYYHAALALLSYRERRDWEAALGSNLRRLWVYRSGEWQPNVWGMAPALAPQVGVKLVDYLLERNPLVTLGEACQ